MAGLIEFVSATRRTRDEFWSASGMGQSLRRLEADKRWTAEVAFEHDGAIAEPYNARIKARSEHDILVFLDNDVWVDNFCVVDLLAEGLDAFDVIGVVGNRRRVPGALSWRHAREREGQLLQDEASQLSGGIAIGALPLGAVQRFGDCPAECELLGGMFIAVRRATLLGSGVRFDPNLGPHFQGLDFCRTARGKGLRLGTWPIALTHLGIEGFDQPEWRAARDRYFRKWKD
jgi:hypothetical protein